MWNNLVTIRILNTTTGFWFCYSSLSLIFAINSTEYMWLVIGIYGNVKIMLIQNRVILARKLIFWLFYKFHTDKYLWWMLLRPADWETPFFTIVIVFLSLVIYEDNLFSELLIFINFFSRFRTWERQEL